MIGERCGTELKVIVNLEDAEAIEKSLGTLLYAKDLRQLSARVREVFASPKR